MNVQYNINNYSNFNCYVKTSTQEEKLLKIFLPAVWLCCWWWASSVRSCQSRLPSSQFRWCSGHNPSTAPPRKPPPPNTPPPSTRPLATAPCPECGGFSMFSSPWAAWRQSSCRTAAPLLLRLLKCGPGLSHQCTLRTPVSWKLSNWKNDWCFMSFFQVKGIFYYLDILDIFEEKFKKLVS